MALTAMERIKQFIEGGEAISEVGGSPVLRAILEKLDAISKSVSQQGDKISFGQQKEISPVSANRMLSLVPKGGLEPPQGLLLTRP
jgi:phage terminase large subunit GpA-like protein